MKMNVLGCEKGMPEVTPHPNGEGECEVMFVFFEHVLSHQRLMLDDGRVIAQEAVEFRIGSRSRSIEVIRTPQCHDAFVVSDCLCVHMWGELSANLCDVTVTAQILGSQEANGS